MDEAMVPTLVRALVLPLAASALGLPLTLSADGDEDVEDAPPSSPGPNPASVASAAQGAALLGDLRVYTGDGPLTPLLSALAARMVAAATGPALLPPWPPRAVAACPGAAALLAARFGRACRLAAAAASWGGALAEPDAWRVRAAVLEGLAARQLVPYARAALLNAGRLPPLTAAAVAAERAGRAAAALPRGWLADPGAEPLAALLAEVGAAFCAAWDGSGADDRACARFGGGLLADALGAVGEAEAAGRVRARLES